MTIQQAGQWVSGFLLIAWLVTYAFERITRGR